MGENVDLENTIREVRSLAKRRCLGGGEKRRFKELVVKLKRGGFGNVEISELTGGKSAPTIKA
jgi:hypothetical protein